MVKRLCLAVFFMVCLVPPTAFAGPVLFSASGDNNPASIQAVVDAFRFVLGNPNNMNNPGPLASGRREINWDGGGGVDATAVAGPTLDAFLNTRGARFVTPGTNLLQAPPAGGPQGGLASFFGNATYGTIFDTFSPLRLFAPAGSNVVDTLFFVPGTMGATPATVSGFGAVFTDVDLLGTTTLQYFDASNNALGAPFVVPVGLVGDGSLSFLGVVFDAGERVGRVRIVSGNAALGPNDGGGVDVVVMDDFLYGEPSALVVAPEPAVLLLLGIGLPLALRASRRRGSRP